MKIALAQINVILGDINANEQKIIDYIDQAQSLGANIIAFPELCICGYPPEDLIFHQDFVTRCYQACEAIIKKHSSNLLIILGTPRLNKDLHSNCSKSFNSALIGLNGEVIECYDKTKLPNYGVFDEKRYFQKGKEYKIINYQAKKILISICEDLWVDEWLEQSPINQADYLITISASPYSTTKIRQRQDLIQSTAKKYAKPVLLCNLVGGQDELVFDGNSIIASSEGKIINQGKHCKEELLLVDLDSIDSNKHSIDLNGSNQLSEIYQVLKLGVEDYFFKNGFKSAILGLSGGIDSAFNLALLVDCLGSENVLAVSMPTRYNQPSSLNDAIKQCKFLNCEHQIFDIDHLFQKYIDEFNQNNQKLSGVSLQNIQARIRANILMAMSNQNNHLLIVTSNKSEIAVGYSTIYGDMAGGFCPLKDVQKTLVYQLSDWLNQTANSEQIPQSVIDKPPSAELMDNQKDSDNLPDYSILDELIHLIMGEKKSKRELYQHYDQSQVDQVYDLLKLNQYKRFQGSPGVKITDSSFSKDWRYPISNQFNF